MYESYLTKHNTDLEIHDLTDNELKKKKKKKKKSETSSYRPISMVPCFSKILERIMYNRVYNFITKNNLLYEKQFGFQAKHSTDNAILELSNSSENKFTLGVFIDLSKAFDTDVVFHKDLF